MREIIKATSERSESLRTVVMHRQPTAGKTKTLRQAAIVVSANVLYPRRGRGEAVQTNVYVFRHKVRSAPSVDATIVIINLEKLVDIAAQSL